MNGAYQPDKDKSLSPLVQEFTTAITRKFSPISIFISFLKRGYSVQYLQTQFSPDMHPMITEALQRYLFQELPAELARSLISMLEVLLPPEGQTADPELLNHIPEVLIGLLSTDSSKSVFLKKITVFMAQAQGINPNDPTTREALDAMSTPEPVTAEDFTSA